MQPKTYPADKHEIDPTHVDPDAVTVLRKLCDAGHIAYLVGGGVRDLLVRKKPKDFDISTSASPEEIKRIFHRQCLLIGRRFRLAHIRFGNKIIEVSTFRSGESGDELIVRDNQWGTPEEDAKRRDFTINGLFLDPTHHQVIDYVGGWEDIHQGVLRTIGDPVVRFKQDPVRMIRLIKFTARFGFTVEPHTQEALHACKREILKSAPARVLEELLRMLESGSSKPFLQQMVQNGLLAPLLPWLAHFLKTSSGEKIYELLGTVDEQMREQGQPPDRILASSCLLFPILNRELHIQYLDKGIVPHIGDITMVTHALIRGVMDHSFPPFTKRMKYGWGFILTTQFRLGSLSKKVHPRGRLLRHPDFPHALALLRVRAVHDESLIPLVEEWTRLEEELQSQEAPVIESEASPPREAAGRNRRRKSGLYHNRPAAPHRQMHGH